MKSILLVEDDEYKALDLLKEIGRYMVPERVERAASVTSALRAISQQNYELVVLDMSLPTFDIAGPGGGGSPEGQGGLEVLRLARRLKNSSPFLIVTQYADIEINGKETNLSDSSAELASMFKVSILACLLYEFDADSWREPFRHILSGIEQRVQ